MAASHSNRIDRAPGLAIRQPLSRRHFLRAAGVSLALPFLDRMLPGIARAQAREAASGENATPRRLFAICNNLGLLKWHFFPQGEGRDYRPSLYLQELQGHRENFTVFSGVSYPNVDGGHPADVCFLTGAPHPASGSFRNSISIDQAIAERIGTLTRFPSLTLAVNTRTKSLSYTGTGVAIPPEDRAAETFRQLFLQGPAEEVEAQVRSLSVGRSILDTIAGQARSLGRQLGASDRDRLDQYFTGVRELESRLQASQGWVRREKPSPGRDAPVDPASPAAYIEKVKIMYDLARLAFQTDSTRAITLMLDSVSTPAIEDIPGLPISDGYHNLSHHGKSEEKLEQLKAIDLCHMKLLDRLYRDFGETKEDGVSLLDRTMIYYGSNFGDAGQHTCANMPVLLAGGGFRHGRHLAFDTERNYPLSNIFVSMLQRMGIEQDRFSSSTGTMRGLEMT